MTDSLQIVRPLHSFERVPEYPPIIDMLMPKLCHVAYVKAPPQDLGDRMQRIWATRRLMSKQQREQAMQRIQPMLADGKSSYQIADAISVSRTTIDRYIQKNNLDRPERDNPSLKIFHENEAAIRRMARKIGVPKTSAEFGIHHKALYRFLEKSK